MAWTSRSSRSATSKPKVELDDDRPKLKRTWPQRLVIAVLGVAAVGSFGASASAWFVQRQLEDRVIVQLDSLEVDTGNAPDGPTTGDTGDDAAAAADGAPVTAATDDPQPVETFPPAEPGARNILITGADNNACLDPDSPYAPAFGDRENIGERSDTIMMWRVNPATKQVAVLSFPRDLWLRIDGRSSKDRINAAYTRDDPQRLINTIQQNFGIETDHFVQVDFCAFKELVDAVGGVAVPFATGVRDGNTGLAVPPESIVDGCFTFSGEHALAYVRSRKLEYFDPGTQTWKRDGTSDLGRITRQQDFIRRVGDQLIANAFSPSVVRSLLDVSRQYIVTDAGLTPEKILELSGVLANSDPADITTYQVEARGTTIQGNSVLEPQLGGDNMQAVLALFRGEVTLAERPEQSADVNTATEDELPDGETTAPSTTVPVVDPDTTTTTTPTTATIVDDSVPDEAVPFEAIPEVDVEENPLGYFPDGDVSCG
ncbi:MAG: LCP family protein [Ilumatobacter sp.]|uniref:LCP family protein n=1 Tax=Ilumatobacter sp. TaxID=1967498 RepID=UPI003299A5ED